MSKGEASSGRRQRAYSFDGVARVYQVLEYASFGRALERTRESYLDRLGGARHALVLGDGDGRFLATLLDRNPELRAVAVDSSRRMLDLLGGRCQAAGERLSLRLVDLRVAEERARLFGGVTQPFDLVVTHFFLDCLTEPELEALVRAMQPRLSHCARWVISEFQTPARGLLRVVGRALIASLYLAFGLLTGLPVRRMPDYAATLTREGFICDERRARLGGLLIGEMWHWTGASVISGGCEVHGNLPDVK